jgi:hypothetical protein
MTRHTKPTSPAQQRFIRGHAATQALLNYWLTRSGLSNGQFCRIAAWGLGDSWLVPNTLSRLRNGRIPSGPNLQQMLAFDAANAAIHCWQTRGPEAAWERFGPHSSHAIRDLWLNDAMWLPVPEDPSEPMAFADFLEVHVGKLELPFLAVPQLEATDAGMASEALSQLLNDAIKAAGLDARDGLAAVLAAYPSQDQDRRSRLMAVVLGMGTYSAEQLEAELWAAAEVISSLRHLPRGQYGPDQLLSELGAGRQP